MATKVLPMILSILCMRGVVSKILIYNASLYVYEEDTLATFKSTKAWCQSLSGHLPSIHSQEELNFLTGILVLSHDNNYFTWLGAILQSDRIIWNDGAAWDYTPEWQSNSSCDANCCGIQLWNTNFKDTEVPPRYRNEYGYSRYVTEPPIRTYYWNKIAKVDICSDSLIKRKVCQIPLTDKEKVTQMQHRLLSLESAVRNHSASLSAIAPFTFQDWKTVNKTINDLAHLLNQTSNQSARQHSHFTYVQAQEMLRIESAMNQTLASAVNQTEEMTKGRVLQFDEFLNASAISLQAASQNNSLLVSRIAEAANRRMGAEEAAAKARLDQEIKTMHHVTAMQGTMAMVLPTGMLLIAVSLFLLFVWRQQMATRMEQIAMRTMMEE